MSQLTQKYQTPSLFHDFFELNPWGLFAFSCGTFALVLFIQQQYVLTEEVYYHTLGEQLTLERLDAFLETQRRWAWLSYVLIPLTFFLQALLVSICLSAGAILLDYPVTFQQVFGIVVRAMVVFAIGKSLQMLAAQFVEIQTIDDFVRADVFSLLGWVGREAMPEWLLYPLSTINVFELLFWILLAGGMGTLLNRSWTRLMGFVAATYGAGLLVWVLFIVFLQLSFQ